MLQSLESELMQLYNIEGNFLKLECCSVAQSCLTLCNVVDRNTPSLSVLHHLPSQWCHPYMLSTVVTSAFSLSRHQGLSNKSALGIRCPKYWCFSFSVSPSNEYSGLIPFGLTPLMTLQSQGLSRVFSNTTVQKHQFFGARLSFIDQLSHTYMTTRKTTALTTQTFFSKVMSLIFNTLSRLVITFFPRRKPLLIS